MTRAAPAEAQVKHLLRGAQAAGTPVAVIERLPDGTIRLLLESPKPAKPDARKPESWD